MEYVFFAISILFLLATSVTAIFFSRKNGNVTRIKPIYILIGGAFLAIFTVMLYADYQPETYGKESTVFLALFHAVQIMLTGYEFDALQEIFVVTEQLSFEYLYISFLFVLGPIYTFGFVLSFFEGVTSYVRYLFKYKRDIYILSDISERSLMLAQSIREKFPKAAIVFMNVFSDTDDDDYDLIHDAKNLKAIFMKKGIVDAKLRLHGKETKAVFFMIGENEPQNVEQTLHVVDRFRDRPNTELFVFATSKESELLLDSIDDGIMRVRRVNSLRIMAHSIISRYPITENAAEKDGKKNISALVVGMGGHGTELVKAFLWCGQLPNYRLRIDAVDMDENAESKFRAECPEIIKLNHNETFGEARYHLHIHGGVDVHTYALHEVIEGLSDTSIVYVCLGDDDLNIETAINLRILLERKGLYPKIRAIVYSEIKHKSLNFCGLVNYNKESYDIELIGNTKTRYEYDTITSGELEKKALAAHLRWANDDNRDSEIQRFNQYEYFRNSSIATVIHEKYREEEGLEGDIASITEHMRWNAYMRTEGFIFSGSYEKKSRNDRAKMHHNLHISEKLSKEDFDKDRRVIGTKK